MTKTWFIDTKCENPKSYKQQPKSLEEFSDKDWHFILELLESELDSTIESNSLMQEILTRIERNKEVYLSIPSFVKTDRFNSIVFKHNRGIEEYLYLLDAI